MYHSVSFFPPKTYDEDNEGNKTNAIIDNPTDKGGRNTWATWRLISSSRPYISPPTQKTVYEDIPFSNGVLDFSEFGLSDSVFNNREGSFSFIAANDMIDGYITGYKREPLGGGNTFTLLSMNGSKINKPHPSNKELNGNLADWDQTYSDIMNFLHGEVRKIVLEDDPSFYYLGRVELESIDSEENYTTYSIKYNVEPFKKVRFSTGNCGKYLLWDAIDFDANLDIKGISGVKLKPNENFSTGEFVTLRNTIYPTITINSSKKSNVAVAKVIVYENGDKNKAWKEFHFGKGTNNLIDSYTYTNKTNPSHDALVEGKNLFYLRDTKYHEVIKVENISNSDLTFTLDYRLEGL